MACSFSVVAVVATCVLLSACDGNSNSSRSADTQAPDTQNPTSTRSLKGTWLAPAYGSATVVEDDRITLYDYTESHCVQAQQIRGRRAQAILNPEQWEIGETQIRPFIAFDGTKVYERAYQRAEALPEVCQNPLLVGDSGSQPENLQRDFDLFWQTFDELYLSFERKGVDWAAQKPLAQAVLSQNPNEAGLFQALAGLMQPLADGHVTLSSDEDDLSFSRLPTVEQSLIAEFIAREGEINSNADRRALFAYVRGQLALIQEIKLDYAEGEVKSAAHGLVSWFVGPDNVGVLMISGMEGFAGDDEDDTLDSLAALKPAMDEAMADLRDTGGLIIDVRDNQGGYDSAGHVITRYFLDTERHLYSKQVRLGNDRTPLDTYRLAPVDEPYLKPVVLLNSRNTASAAEVFGLMMRNLPHVTLMGEASQGELSDMLEKRLPNGWSFTLSNEFYLSPQGEWFEHQGIPVSQEIPYATMQDREEEKDSGLEAAYAHLMEQIQ